MTGNYTNGDYTNSEIKSVSHAKMVECGICLEEYQEGDLEHQETCVVRLMFRCSLCDEDYVSKEGLWNHLDLHEIVDESKELHYQEIKAKYKLHQCVLCNDQRAYSESLYWKHVHDVHDGFFLRCSYCGENFRSEKLKNDHASSHCKARDQMEEEQVDSLASVNDDVVMDSHVIDKESPMVSVAPLNDSIERQVVSEKTSHLLVENLSNRRYSCNICGVIFNSKYQIRHHKLTKHTEEKFQCPNCSRKFHFKKKLEDHASCCADLKHACDLCGQKFNLLSRVENHKKRVHHGNIPLRNVNIDIPHCTEEQKQNIVEKMDATQEMSDSSDPKVSVRNPSSESSCAKCSHCGIEESGVITLAHHILIHHDPVACDFCGSTFSSLFHAQHHMKVTHKESKLKCPHCLTQFCWRGRLQRHLSHCKDEKVPCDFCGRMFKDASAVTKHKTNVCLAYKGSKQKKKKNSETSQCDETDPSSVKEKNSLPLAESGLSQTKCYYCDEEFSSPGYLKHHLRICHKLTKCDICGITVFGLSGTKNHKIKCHLEPKHKCPTCGKQFHRKKKYDSHCFTCENKMHSCKLCGRTFKQLHSIKRHITRDHPDESSLENIQIVQVQNKVRNDDLNMEITAEETEDQGQSTIVKESPMISVTPLNSGSERQVVSEKTSQPLLENLSNQPCSCNICGIILNSNHQIRHHKLTKHTEEKFQCPHCSRKFYFRTKLKDHVSCCAGLKHACDLCGQKFNHLSRVKNHKKRFHRDSKPLRTANIEGVDCTEKQKQNSVETMDAAHELTSCIICRIPFASTEELMKHKLTCSKNTKEPYASELGAEEISLFHDVKGAQTDSTIIPQDEGVELKLEIKVEETTLQEEQYQVPNEDPGRSFGTALHSYGGKSKDTEAEDTEDHDNKIIVKEEYLEEEEDYVLTEHRNTTESSKCQGIPSDPFYPCSICGIKFGKKTKMRYHKVVCHTEPQYKCTICEKMFHFANYLRRHEKGCSELRCHICAIKFTSRALLTHHNIDEHPHDGKSKNVEAVAADDPENGINVKEKCPEDEEQILTGHQRTTESAECHEVLSDRKKSLVRQEVMDSRSNAKRKRHS